MTPPKSSPAADLGNGSGQKTPAHHLYALLTGDEDARVCKEIPDSACKAQPGSFVLHLLSSLASKTADELASAKLVIAWLLGAVGAPAGLVGLLVPIREAGALLPQIAIAATLRRMPVRKWMWVAGSVTQGLSAAGMAAAAVTLKGAAAGWTIVALLALFSVARGVCSVTHKDVLGKNIDSARRGTAMGYAGAVAGVVTVGVGVYLAAFESAGAQTLAVLLAAAALLWFIAAAIFANLDEQPGATEGGANALDEAIRSFALLRRDQAFRQFVITRALMLSTAFSLPYYVALAVERSGAGAAGLGQFLLASGIAAAVSAPIWGRLADRSGRLTLAAAALLAGLSGCCLYTLVSIDSPWLADRRIFALFFLVLSIAHTGVRLGRKTYLIDLATSETRAAYVAVSNSLIGILLLAGAAIGLIANRLGTDTAIAGLAVVALSAAASAWRLPELD